MKCTKCGYEFFEGIFCPECGTKYEEVILDEKEVAEATERERKSAEEAAAEEAKKIVAAEKASIRENAEKEEREKAIRIAQEEAIQKAKEDEEKRHQEEAEKKANEEKVINRKAILSLVLGIISWVLIFTVIVPLITTVWSIIDGIKALKGKTKHKKKAVIGIILSGFWWVLMIWIAFDIALYDGGSSTSANTSSATVDTEKVSETDIEVENEVVVETNIEGEADAKEDINMVEENADWEPLPEGDPYIFRYDSEDYYIIAELYPASNDFYLDCKRFDSGKTYSTFEVNARISPVQDEKGNYYGENGAYYKGGDPNTFCTVFAEADYGTKYLMIELDKYDFKGVLDYVYVDYPEELDGVDDGIADLENMYPYDFFGDKSNRGKVFRCNCIYWGNEDGYLVFDPYIRRGQSDFTTPFYAKTDKDFGSFFTGDAFNMTAVWKDIETKDDEIGGHIIVELVDLQEYSDESYNNSLNETPAETSESNTNELGESWFEDGDLYNVNDRSISLTFVAINNSRGPTAEVFIINDGWSHQYMLYMEDERHGYLTYTEGGASIGSLSFTMDGVVVDCGIPAVDGTYWY